MATLENARMSTLRDKQVAKEAKAIKALPAKEEKVEKITNKEKK